MTMVTNRPTERRGEAREAAPDASADAAPDASADAAPGASAGAASPAPRHTPGYAARTLRRLRPSLGLAWAVTAALLLVAAGVAATLGRTAWQDRRAEDDRAAALAAGRQIAVNFVTVSAASFDADTRRVLDEATGSFKKEYQSTLAQLKPVVTANHTDSRVERAEAALVSAGDGSARVIVGLVAPTTNSATPTPEKKTYRLRLDLVKVGDAWKVSSLDFVS